MTMIIYFATDHAGFELKEALVPFVRELGYDVEDMGAHVYNEGDDYPDYIAPAAEQVSSAEAGEEQGKHTAMAIILGGSGQGEAIVANRFPGVRAIVFNGQYNPDDRDVPDEIRLSREHNDANILSLGARFLNEAEAKEAVEKWLATPYREGERHSRRLEKIDEITKERCRRLEE